MKTYIIGHQKPDTDAVVACLALAFLHPQTTPVITDPLNPETTYLFNKYGVTAPQLIKAQDITPEDRVILVDHNEESQRLEGLDPNQIVEIIDHHKANINFPEPITLTFKTWGSSTTIVFDLMKSRGVTPDKTLATLMLSAVLSDTVGFKSSTTTDKDKEVGQELAQIAGITDVESLTLEIFKAKSDISKLTDEQIVKNDYKIFDFSEKTFIDQLETVEQQELLATKKDSLLKAMQTIKDQEQVELLFVAITDILKVNTKLLILSQKEGSVAEKAFGGKVTDNVLDIGPKLSRKKDIAPAIEKALK